MMGGGTGARHLSFAEEAEACFGQQRGEGIEGH